MLRKLLTHPLLMLSLILSLPLFFHITLQDLSQMACSHWSFHHYPYSKLTSLLWSSTACCFACIRAYLLSFFLTLTALHCSLLYLIGKERNSLQTEIFISIFLFICLNVYYSGFHVVGARWTVAAWKIHHLSPDALFNMPYWGSQGVLNMLRL